MARLPDRTRNATFSEQENCAERCQFPRNSSDNTFGAKSSALNFVDSKMSTVSILDFYCAQAKVCVEIDGEQHADQVEYDKFRDEEMTKLGILTLRFPSLEIFEKSPGLDHFLNLIYENCCGRTGKRPARWWE